jgi:predicted transcriptional regulator
MLPDNDAKAQYADLFHNYVQPLALISKLKEEKSSAIQQNMKLREELVSLIMQTFSDPIYFFTLAVRNRLIYPPA